MNLMQYAFNSPNNWVDPYGLRGFDSNSSVHTKRNINNKCPKFVPQQGSSSNNNPDSDGGSDQDSCPAGNSENSDDGGYYDHLGNPWEEDPGVGNFHGREEDGFQTFRGTGPLTGSQCTYFNGRLLDSGQYMGTYDYVSPNNYGNLPFHVDNDVIPHLENPNYDPFLTEQY
jgi:hypothetical protein